MSATKTYQAVIENLNTAVLLLDDALRVNYLNPAAEMLFAISARQARGTAATALMPDSRVFLAALRRALDTQHPFTEHDLQLHIADAPVTLDGTVTPLGPHKLLVEFLRAERHRRIAREENLLAQYEANRAVLRGLAHEINNPLGGLRGAAQLLERELPGDTFKEYTQVIIGEADRLRNLLNRLLGPSNLPQKQASNIHHVLERVRSVVLAEMPAGIQIARDYDPSIPDLHADPDQIIQAALNIVRNAAQVLDGRGGRITLRTRVQRQFTIGPKCHKLVARIDISDDGPGVPPGLLEHIFYPMVTGRAEGTGLGLSIAQALVNQHGGLIECASVPGATTFTLLLPIENGLYHA
jgi:two-component system nitrogen regulation sensor histidine kinase GlnL